MTSLGQTCGFTPHLDSYKAKYIVLLALSQQPSYTYFTTPTDSCKAKCVVPLAVFQQPSCIKTAARAGHLVEKQLLHAVDSGQANTMKEHMILQVFKADVSMQ